MKKKTIGKFVVPVLLLLLFIVWTVVIKFFDVQAIGPLGSEVGFASLNGAFHNLTGVHLGLYNATDLLEIIPIVFVGVFGLTGLIQLIKRKSLLKVDPDILVLGVFYIAVFASFVLFEILEINYRPVLIEGVLEASYPSSTTLLVLCVMPSVINRIDRFIKNPKALKAVKYILVIYTAFMAIARLVSGVHWLTDIAGGISLSCALLSFYFTADEIFASKK